MKYAILAAGHGLRLVQEGETSPKPLIQVGGESLIDRLLRVFMTNDATEIAVICNPQMTAVAAYLETIQKAGRIPLRIFQEQAFAAYVQAFRQMTSDGLMGVTDYIDDERPLYVSTDAALRITDFTDTSDRPHYISAGIYGLTPRCFETLGRCIERGEQRMRNFQRALIADGFKLQAWPFSKVFDIDHVSDIQKAEQFLSV